MKLSSLELFAAENHGLVTRNAAERCGISRASWYRAIAAGSLVAVHRNVARVPGSPPTTEQTIAAAVLAGGSGAMASHRSAARLLGIPRPDDDPVEVLFNSRRRGLEMVGVTVHHPRDLKDLTPLLRHNIRTSNVLRTLCDLGAVDPAGVSAAVGHVVTLRLASPVALVKAINRHSRPGRPGVPALREALNEWLIDGLPPDSILEPAMRRLLRKYRFPPAEFHARIAGLEVDFWIVATPVVLECDGWNYHGKTRAQFERMYERDSVLIAAGYLPVHFTYAMVMKRPAVVAQRIRNALDRWGWVGEPRLVVASSGIRN